MTAKLAILPQRQPTLRQQDPVQLTQRPKLQINTQQLRTFGKGSTSLRLDTLSAISPTVRNTFSNAYERATATTAAVPAPLERPTKPRLGLLIDENSCPKPSSSNPQSSSTPNSASTLLSAVTSASSNESATIHIPYKQPYNLVSILSNSPARNLLPRKMAAARPLFPAEKKVSFRTPLEEEITNTKYTMAHSDLQSSVSSGSTISSVVVPSPPSVESESESPSASLTLSIASSSSSSVSAGFFQISSSEQSTTSESSSQLEASPPPSRGPQTGDKRDSSESDSDSAPETPVAGRRKRRRDWKWTLGPLPSGKSSSSSTTTSGSTASEDNN